ncbi:MAG: hypothetical protein IH591_12780 [Bacteroidales bacterium]|nr:hypothetical protein [Bacteroidales bacterium]
MAILNIACTAEATATLQDAGTGTGQGVGQGAEPVSESHTVTLAGVVSVSFSLSLPDTTASFTSLLMRIERGKTIFLSLYLTSSRGDTSSITMVGTDAIQTYKTVINLTDNGETEVSVLMNSDGDSLTLIIGGSEYTFLRPGFVDGAKYNITILPEMITNYDAAGNPVIEVNNVKITGDIQEKGSYTEIFLLLLLVVADILVFVIIHFRNKARRKRENRVRPRQISISNVELARQEVPQYSAVKLFGGFNIYSADGEELSKLFSPTLKELFLLLLCRQSDAGISSSKLKDLLWFDKSDESARNNRSVYITKLRQILDKIGPHEISRASGNWKIDMKEITVDYLLFNDIISRSTITEKGVTDLIQIIRQGTLLPECNYQWLDDIKARTADSAITILTNYAEHLQVRERPDLVLSIAEALFVLDPVSDMALSYKCKYLNHTGKGYLAKQLYTTFAKDYKHLYGEDYRKTYSDIIIEEPE